MRGIIWKWQPGDRFYFWGNEKDSYEVTGVTDNFLRWQRDGVRYLTHTSLVSKVRKGYEN